MSGTLRVKPVEGRRVRCPGTGEVMKAAGAEVPASPFWLRRMRDGDVVEVQEAPAAAPLVAAIQEVAPTQAQERK